MKRIGVVVLAVVLVLVVGAEIFLFARLKGCAAEREAADGIQGTSGGNEAVVAESAQITPEPPPAVVEITPVPMPTQAPVTPTPVPIPTQIPVTPTPVPPPTAVPTPTAAPAASGSFASDTGTALNMTVDWTAEDLGNGTARVHVTGRISSYSLDVGSTYVAVAFGGQSVSCSVESILIGNDDYTETDLFSTTLDVPRGTVGTMTADWSFNGSYSGVPLPSIMASGTVSA